MPRTGAAAASGERVHGSHATLHVGCCLAGGGLAAANARHCTTRGWRRRRRIQRCRRPERRQQQEQQEQQAARRGSHGPREGQAAQGAAAAQAAPAGLAAAASGGQCAHPGAREGRSACHAGAKRVCGLPASPVRDCPTHRLAPRWRAGTRQHGGERFTQPGPSPGAPCTAPAASARRGPSAHLPGAAHQGVRPQPGAWARRRQGRSRPAS